ncbi:MAG: tRNA 2-thiouridine(34) synthase MnmA [candidate division Zixibacteria bacterium]
MGKRVLIGLSGGVDSSVAAALLIEQGYEVIGVTLKLYDYDELGFDPPNGGCCSLDLIEDARAACARMNIPHYVIDLREDFRKDVIDDFIESYSQGRTPNPCVNCNTHIKWGKMLATADKLGCDFVATGHYARVDHSARPLRLLKGVDNSKDQSYALWGIPRETLGRTLFPLGEISKQRTREIAKKLGLRNADRPDSQEICFVPQNDYAYILKQKLGEDAPSLRPGPIYDIDGNEVGRHKGIASYTIGQRRGLGISNPSPLYVTRIDPTAGSITVGREKHLYAERFSAANLNLLTDDLNTPRDIDAKIRYRHQPAPATLTVKEKIAQVVFRKAQRAITPGQSVVFYEGDRLIGGGIIDTVY